MASKRIAVDFPGIKTDTGADARDPSALSTATNVELREIGRLKARDGFFPKEFLVPGGIWSLYSSKQLGDDLIAHARGAARGDRLYFGDGSAAWTQLFDITGVGNTIQPYQVQGYERLALVSAGKNHYASTLVGSSGTARIESDFATSTQFYYAGMPRAPGFDQSRVTGGNAGLVDATTLAPAYPANANWLANGSSVAYRAVWVSADADGKEMFSPPSGRWVITNSSGGARAMRLRAYLPRQTNTQSQAIVNSGVRKWRLQVYRSLPAVGAPGDEMQLVWDGVPANLDITNGYMEVIDVCIDGAQGAYLYTNTVSGGDVNTLAVGSGNTSLGLLAANDRPPLCTNISFFQDCVFYSGIQTPYRLTFSILAVGTAGNVLKAGDTLTIDGTVYTAIVPGVPAANQFVVVTAGAVLDTIRATAINLVEAINSNLYGGSALVATYTGSTASLGTAGRILLESQMDAAAVPDVVVSAGSGLPYLPTLTTVYNGDSEVQSNGIAISKPGIYDAVPPANYITVGRDSTNIIKTIATTDALWIFTDDGLYWLRGRNPSEFTVDEFDLTVRAIGRECICAMDEAVYAVTTRGIVRITPSGVQSIDQGMIQNDVLAFLNTYSAPLYSQHWYAIANPRSGQVLFGLNGNASPGSEYVFAFHVQTNRWSLWQFDTTHAFSPTCGVLRWSDEKLYLGEYLGDTTSSGVFNPVAGAFTDTHSGETDDAPVNGRFTWTAQVPDPSELIEWEELQIHFTAAVDGLTITLTTDEGVTTTLSPSGLSGRVVRLEIPTTARLSRSLSVAVSAVDFVFEVSSLVLLYSPVSEVTTR